MPGKDLQSEHVWTQFQTDLLKKTTERKKRSMNRTAVGILSNLGISVSRCVDVQLVRRLIKRLHPVTTDKKLIRIGEEGDGGYLVPDDLDDVVACFSPGVGAVASFEAA